jgi:hypothetical protein
MMLVAMTVRAQKRSLRKSAAMEQEKLEKVTELYASGDAQGVGGMTPFFAAG